MSVPNQPATDVEPSGVFTNYRPPLAGFDEMKAEADSIRPHWQSFVRSIETLGPDGLRERRASAQQLLREHGVTYNVHADGLSAARTWDLDLLPLLIGAAEWAQLEAGLIQRTRLLNLVLADIYGPQHLLREGLFPPALLHANPGFLRPCHGLRPPGDRFLTLHAIDVTRAPNGQWWVLSDRTQAPSGVGYTLENRIIISRVLAEEFRACHVQRLAGFFVACKAGLRALAPWTNAPNVVLLTPGPFAETYFEHAYLARYLGYPLVEGNDLTVRERRVFMKTLEGLQPVDVIVRRVDDTFCDPLELRTDSVLGVPGLVEAARAGHVAISNALGSGAVEAPALLAFLPALVRKLLGEELRLPNVATWWCGQQREREDTLARLGSMVVKRSFVGGSNDPVFAGQLPASSRDELIAQVRHSPHTYVAQERVALSTAPVWNGEWLEPRPLILRCYVCATADGFAVMPGGLTRVAAEPDSATVSSKHGGGSKDTWVLSEAPVDEVTLLDRSGAPAHLERAAQVPSRAVENLFWMGRYAERLEHTARLLRIALSRLAGESGPAENAELAAVARWLADVGKLPKRFGRSFTFPQLMTALDKLVFDQDEPGTVRALLRRLAFLTASVRDRFSGDTWRILNQLQTEFPPAPKKFSAASALGALHQLVFQLAAFSGMELENMTRDAAWRFLDLGRRLERASNVLANIRSVVVIDPTGAVALAPLLEYSDSTMTYRRRYFARPELPAVLHLLLADSMNPRSLAFQINRVGKHLSKLPGTHEELPERQKFGELHEQFKTADFRELGAAAVAGKSKPLNAVLAHLQDACWHLSDLLSAHYFSHVPARVN
jgi:uncharacterized circularly permuted ATP-grasp superfamily protein/uncharacterized alpha-E superfamily protein